MAAISSQITAAYDHGKGDPSRAPNTGAMLPPPRPLPMDTKCFFGYRGHISISIADPQNVESDQAIMFNIVQGTVLMANIEADLAYYGRIALSKFMRSMPEECKGRTVDINMSVMVSTQSTFIHQKSGPCDIIGIFNPDFATQLVPPLVLALASARSSHPRPRASARSSSSSFLAQCGPGKAQCLIQVQSGERTGRIASTRRSLNRSQPTEMAGGVVGIAFAAAALWGLTGQAGREPPQQKKVSSAIIRKQAIVVDCHRHSSRGRTLWFKTNTGAWRLIKRDVWGN
ncbi:uncharacterized protein E0L32_004958 [Thyridium curvatum]|uniref:Uncharacterized protein n=1 Tax=Thyridium curvatum TaxID=1093900 RepID=A0A507BBT4_9PEZI|nr:uncharacterized protein E0L32_004958 [Thyridium curvatum]TPX14849.1 hypothetical protein E0L32_004958 [Thyridium curvatum]